jgi:hypothetical protein
MMLQCHLATLLALAYIDRSNPIYRSEAMFQLHPIPILLLSFYLSEFLLLIFLASG